MKPGGSRPPFFCVHALTGSAFPYHHLVLHLKADQPFYGLQARGLDGQQEPLRRIEDIAALYVEAVRRIQPRGPYHLGGYSFGGWVAYEMAQLLTQAGEQVLVLAMFGTGAPLSTGNPAAFSYADMALRYVEDFNRLVTNSILSEQVRFGGPTPQVPSPEAYLTPMQRVTIANTEAMWRYLPRPYSGALDVFVTPEQLAMFQTDPSMGWQTLCSRQVRTIRVEGNHLNMFEEPQVRGLAQALTACLEEQGVS